MPVNENLFPLSDLIALLQAKGFELTLEQVLQLQTVLLGTELSRLSTAKLKHLVTPLVACNAAEQQQVYALIDTFVAARIAGKDVPLAAPARRRYPGKQFWYRVRFALLGLVLVAGVVLFALEQFGPKGTSAPPIVTTEEEAPKPDTGVVKKTPAPISPDTSMRPLFTASVEGRKPIAAVAINYNLQVSCLLGIILGIILFIVLFQRTNKAFVQQPNKKVRPAQSPQALAHTDGRGEEGSEALDEQPEDIEVSFPDQDHLIAHGQAWPAIRRNLLRAQLQGPERLNIPATIRATIRQAGLLQPTYSAASRPVQFILLIDDSVEGSILPRLFQLLTGYWVAGRLPARVFRVDGAAIVYDNYGKRHNVEEIIGDQPGAQLLFFGDGTGLAAVSGEGWQQTLAAHPAKTLVTPVPASHWGSVELRLEEQGWHIVPAEEEALAYYTRQYASGQTVPPGFWKQKLFAVPGQETDFRTAAGLRSYLRSDALFQFVCCLSVYPRIDWNLAIALWQAFAQRGPHGALFRQPDYTGLLWLGRIPWLREGRLEPEIRLLLLQALTPESEAWARATILELLEEIALRDPGQARGGEYHVQYGLHAFFLYVHDQGRYSRYKESRDLFPELWRNLDEWELRVRLHDDRSGLLPVNLAGRPVTVDEFILQEKEFETKNVRLSKASVLLLPAFLTYILFFLLRPYAIYPDDLFEKVTIRAVVLREASCGAHPDAALMLPGSRKELRLQDLSPNDTLLLPGRQYGESMEFILKAPGRPWAYVPFEAKDSLLLIRVGCK